MRQRVISSHIPFVYPSNEEIYQEAQPSIDIVKAINSSEVRVPDVYVINSPEAKDDVIGDIPEPTNVSYDPPPKVVSV